jgi:hypothetical protein
MATERLMTGTDICPVCAEPLKVGDVCASDIEMGVCHAECLEGSPVVDLDTGDPVDGPVSTYIFEPNTARSAEALTIGGNAELLHHMTDTFGPSPDGAVKRDLDDALAARPHFHVPSTMHMGDCAICGNIADAPQHIAAMIGPNPLSLPADVMRTANAVCDEIIRTDIRELHAQDIIARAIVASVVAEREAIAEHLRYYASLYAPHSDGRNTFIIAANWIEARK